MSLDGRGLRKFGLTTGAIVVALFGLALPWALGHSFPIWPWLIALPLWALGLFLPSTLQPIYRLWMRVGAVVGTLNTMIILGVVFYVLVTPMGLVLRWLGKDAMNRQLGRASTYRISSRTPSAKHMERPF